MFTHCRNAIPAAPSLSRASGRVLRRVLATTAAMLTAAGFTVVVSGTATAATPGAACSYHSDFPPAGFEANYTGTVSDDGQRCVPTDPSGQDTFGQAGIGCGSFIDFAGGRFEVICLT